MTLKARRPVQVGARRAGPAEAELPASERVGDAGESRDPSEALRRAQAESARLNEELQTFCHAVAHDLRAPLRTVAGFALALRETAFDTLDEEGRHFLECIEAGAAQMDEFITGLLGLSRINSAELLFVDTSLSELAEEIARASSAAMPDREVRLHIAPDIVVDGDPRLLRTALEHLLSNALKFTEKTAEPRIEFGTRQVQGETVYFVADNGAGFDMANAERLFGAFQRLHAQHEFPGTGIGLATVKRVIARHGGRVWAAGQPGKGATFYFTLPGPGER